MGAQEIALALQRGLPLCARPFEELSHEAGCTEGEMLAELARLRSAGEVRRFGAVFDTRRLGYASALCAAAVPRGEVDAAAAKVTPHPGVTHCYLREPAGGAAEGVPNLWFTLSVPQGDFAREAERLGAALAPHAMRVLPATRRYKVDVVFGGASRPREERVEDAELPPPDGAERRAIAALQGDTEARPDYFAAVAERVGMREWDLLSMLEMWRRRGRLKRIGLLLRHREAGWKANGMCCWRVAGSTLEAGRRLAALPEVTHCYERPQAPEFPYNLFAMIHAKTLEGALEQSAALRAELEGCAPEAFEMLVSVREYKKTSMTFFV